MTIAVFTDTFYPQVNGVVTHIFDTIPLLAKHNKIVIFAPLPAKNNHQKLDLGDAEIVYLPSIPTFIYKDLRATSPFSFQVQKKIAQLKPDVIHIHSPATVGLSGMIAAQKNHIPIIGTFHGYFMEPEYLRIVGLDKIPFTSKILWTLSIAFYNQADIVICPSEAVRNDLVSHGVKKPIKVVSNGINLDEFGEKRIDNEYSLPLPYFLYVGRVSPEKNLDILIHAFADLKNKSFHLVIVGDGPILNELKNLANSLAVADRVQFLGEISRDKLIKSNILFDALAFVTASTSETQGISVLEAMAAGLPIIGVNAKAVPDLIEGNGILCKPNDIQSFTDAMQNLIDDPEKVAAYKKSSLEVIKKHSIKNTIKELEHIYQSLQKN